MSGEWKRFTSNKKVIEGTWRRDGTKVDYDGDALQ